MRLFMLALGFMIVVSAGCASSQSASSASTPVDVTGTWVGTWTRGNFSGPYTLRLAQTGSKVVGEAVVPGYPNLVATLKDALKGTS